MGETALVVGIEEVEVLRADLSHFFSFVDRLSATAYTAARACHNFYEVVEYFTSCLLYTSDAADE